MEQKQIKAVELVRRIRDQHYESLKGKSPDEVKAFFEREAAIANAEAERLLQAPSASGDHPSNQSV